MEENNFSNERKNSPRNSWTAFFQELIKGNPNLTFTLVLILLAVSLFFLFRNYATELVAFLSTLAIGIAVPILLAIKGKK